MLSGVDWNDQSIFDDPQSPSYSQPRRIQQNVVDHEFSVNVKSYPKQSHSTYERAENLATREIALYWPWYPWPPERRLDDGLDMWIDGRTINPDVTPVLSALRSLKCEKVWAYPSRERCEAGEYPELARIIADTVATDELPAHWYVCLLCI